MTKICNKCKIEKSIEYFNKESNNKSGFRGQCKECRKEYLLANKEKISKQSKLYNTKNKEDISKQKKEYYNKNKDMLSIKKKEYKKKNKDKIRIQNKEYRENNKEKRKENERLKLKDENLKKGAIYVK
jgi:hypothetical protein